ncbi:ABC transporter permease [Leadbetterella sp. DM7]|uniref:ABC transporter permease n=1 Tax=Leadbetterella sp. DM7 TaxID=3235085 RepID=UPI00349EA08D
MKISYFIANRIRNPKGRSFSRVIVRVGILSVAITVSVIILSFFVLLGFKNTIKEKLFSQTSHIQVSKITLNRSFEEAPVPNNSEYFKQVSELPGVRSVSRVAYKSVILKSAEEISGVVVKGVDKEYDWTEFEKNLVEGRVLHPDSANEIILSTRIAGILNAKVGESIFAYFIQDPPRARKLTVTGIYDTHVEELDQLYVLADLSLIQRINGWENGEFGHLDVYLKDISRMKEVKSQLLDIFPQDYKVTEVEELLPHFFEWFKFLDRNIVLIIVLIMVVAAFNMISVLLIMIMERTPMIGLLKSLGSSNALIRRIFLINSSRIILYGLLLGNALALVLSFVQWKFELIRLDAQNYYMNYVPIEWSWLAVAGVNLGVFIVVLLVTVLPTFSITRISPVTALKYKD